MNVLNKRENARFVHYVHAKAEEMVADANSRQRFNRSYSVETHGTAETGPNGIH